MLKGSKVLIRLCPMIRGEIIDPVNGVERKHIDFLRQKVWTVDCQTHAQWKASQKEPTSEVAQHPSHSPSTSVAQNCALEVTDSTSLDYQTAQEAQVQKSGKSTDDTTLSPPDANPNMVAGLSEAQASCQSSAPDSQKPISTNFPDTKMQQSTMTWM